MFGATSQFAFDDRMEDSECISETSTKGKGLYKLSMKNESNSTSSLCTRLSLTDISWTTDEGIMTQAQTFYLITDDNAFIMIQLAYSNLGITSSCQVTARYHKLATKTSDDLSLGSSRIPSCSTSHSKSSSGSSFSGMFGSFLRKSNGSSLLERPTPEFHEFISQNFSASNWKRNNDGFSSEVGPLSITLVSSVDESQDQSVHIVYTNEKLSLDAVLVPLVHPLQFGDGCVHVEKRSDSKSDSLGYASMRYCPKMSVTGHVILHAEDKKFSCNGHASLFQVTHKIKPHLLAQSWSLAMFHSDKESIDTESKKDQDCVSLVLLHLNAPSSVNHEFMNQGMLCIGQEIHALSLNDNQVQFLESLHDHHSGRDIPTRMTYQWSGETASEQPWNAKLHVEPKGLIDRIDLLAQVPFLIRKFIQAFITKPFCYEWLDREVVLELTIGDDAPRNIKGKLLHELTLL